MFSTTFFVLKRREHDLLRVWLKESCLSDACPSHICFLSGMGGNFREILVLKLIDLGVNCQIIFRIENVFSLESSGNAKSLCCSKIVIIFASS